MVRRNGDLAFSSRSLNLKPEQAAAMVRRRNKPLLLCLSHLRWDFVWQRPQHLLSRAARDFNVVVFEEPMWRDGVAPHLEITKRAGGIRVAVPVLPHGTY